MPARQSSPARFYANSISNSATAIRSWHQHPPQTTMGWLSVADTNSLGSVTKKKIAHSHHNSRRNIYLPTQIGKEADGIKKNSIIAISLIPSASFVLSNHKSQSTSQTILWYWCPYRVSCPNPYGEIREALHDPYTERHPNFIEGPSNEVSMEELAFKNIIPIFSDNSLTISHQKFIETTRKAAEVIFGAGTFITSIIKETETGQILSGQAINWLNK